MVDQIRTLICPVCKKKHRFASFDLYGKRHYYVTCPYKQRYVEFERKLRKKRYKKRRIKTSAKTTTKKGKREYQRKYMRLVRKEQHKKK